MIARGPHVNGDLDIVGAPYTRRKANVTEALWVVVSYKRKYVLEVMVNCLFKLPQEKV